jgi:hypothetical protein
MAKTNAHEDQGKPALFSPHVGILEGMGKQPREPNRSTDGDGLPAACLCVAI